MSDYEQTVDKLKARFEEIQRKHKKLDKEIEERYNNVTVSEEVRRLKTMKLYYKDEMHRINAQLIQLGLE